MGYPIDLVFLGVDGRVKRIVADMGPWRMVLSGHGGHDCLELPGGARPGARRWWAMISLWRRSATIENPSAA